MNIFALHPDARQSAKWLCDKHMKMLIESCQMLCTVYHEQGIDAPYRPSHRSHPCSIWCRESYDNFQWLIEHAYAISDEYTARYGKVHKSLEVLKWCDANISKLYFKRRDMTPHAVAISEDCLCRQQLPEFDTMSVYDQYKAYYKIDKAHIHQWKRNKPEWL